MESNKLKNITEIMNKYGIENTFSNRMCCIDVYNQSRIDLIPEIKDCELAGGDACYDALEDLIERIKNGK